MDPVLLEKAILERKAVTGKYPKAIVPVALYGIPVVEDAAEGMGSCYDANFWLCAATIDLSVHVSGQEDAYKEVIKTAQSIFSGDC